MAAKKDKIPLKERKWFKVVTNKYLIATLIFLVIIVFIDKNNVIDWIGSRIDVARQERIIRKYNKDIEVMDEKLKELSSNTDSLEKFAREQFYFQKENEDVFIVE